MNIRHCLIVTIIAVAAGCTDDPNVGAPDVSHDASMPDMNLEDIAAPEVVCGDRRRDGAEACDDGNTVGDDGCSADCTAVEDGWSCPDEGRCVLGERCGDGAIGADEACDDANELPDDGCAADCSAVDDGWVCPVVGRGCIAAGCGDAVRVDDEECDDGNMNDGDGCSADCAVEAGWVCVGDGNECIAQQCGDGIVAGEEACDDGNMDGGDGCAADCGLVEPNFICPTAASPCESTVVCGDRRVGPSEQCDDGNTTPGDGCGATCDREQGWACPVPGAACRAEACGDGFLVDLEACDDMNTADGDGCSSTCEVEQGWACPAAAACYQTTCGDGIVEGTEQCDDRNVRPLDGCSESCANEPDCAAGTCTPICGDAVILPGPTQEACDDGNTADGDGCSAMCEIEVGWSCAVAPEPLPNTIVLPLILRDFKGIEWYSDDATNYGHPDFNDPDDGNPVIAFGIVNNFLNAAGRPVLSYAAADPMDGTGLPKFSARFDEWYDSASPWNIEEVRYLTLTRPAAGSTFVYDSTISGFAPNSTSGFYPIDDGGWVAQGSEALRTAHATINDGGDHNFNFTTETRFFFQYSGDEVLTFSGDDDLWVFIDGRLCLDVGGLHGELGATMNLADPTQEADLTQRAIVQACKAHLDGLVTPSNPEPLVKMSIFHAERHTSASNFELELTDFVKQRSTCAEICGDAIVTRGEVCDDGVNDGAYNGCNADCLSLGGYCGDAEINGAEACDDGVNLNDGRYQGCNPDCTPAGFCGDAIVQPRDEVCDDGLNDGSYGGCASDCQTRSPHCGDGEVNGPEACDEGLGGNIGNYDGCNPDCTLGPYCGDGVKNGDEECDDGDTDDANGCKRDCTRPIL